MYVYIKNFGIDKCKIIEDYGAQVKIEVPNWDTEPVLFKENIYKTREEAQVIEYKKQAKVLNKKINTLQKNLQYCKDIFEIDSLRRTNPELFLI